MQGFAGKVAVVTGAGSGIGRSTAMLLARLGAIVHVADIANAEGVVGEIVAAGGQAAAHSVDVTDASAVEALAERVYESGGACDILHNNAGIGVGGAVEEIPLEDWRRVVEVNLMGVVHGVHHFLPRMLAQGRGAHIVNTASMAGLVPAPSLVPYCMTKFGVVGLSETLNAELSPRGIHVTAICPGLINTPIVASARMSGDIASRRARMIEFYRRRGVSPDVVADAVVDAIRRKQIIRTVPRSHVVPVWALHRISARTAAPLTRLANRVMAGR